MGVPTYKSYEQIQVNHLFRVKFFRNPINIVILIYRVLDFT